MIKCKTEKSDDRCCYFIQLNRMSNLVQDRASVKEISMRDRKLPTTFTYIDNIREKSTMIMEHSER